MLTVKNYKVNALARRYTEHDLMQAVEEVVNDYCDYPLESGRSARRSLRTKLDKLSVVYMMMRYQRDET